MTANVYLIMYSISGSRTYSLDSFGPGEWQGQVEVWQWYQSVLYGQGALYPLKMADSLGEGCLVVVEAVFAPSIFVKFSDSQL